MPGGNRLIRSATVVSSGATGPEAPKPHHIPDGFFFYTVPAAGLAREDARHASSTVFVKTGARGPWSGGGDGVACYGVCDLPPGACYGVTAAALGGCRALRSPNQRPRPITAVNHHRTPPAALCFLEPCVRLVNSGSRVVLGRPPALYRGDIRNASSSA